MQNAKLTARMIKTLPKAGAHDPIAYYRYPLVGGLLRRRINLGLAMLPPRVFERALVLGAGGGALELALSARATELHGVAFEGDPEPTQRALEARGCAAKLVRGSAYSLPYADGYFELVAAFSVLEHLDDYPQALAEAARVLRPSSYLLIGMRASSLLVQAATSAILPHGRAQPIIRPAQVKARFVGSGFRVLGEHHLYFPARKPIGAALYYNWLLSRVRTQR